MITYDYKSIQPSLLTPLTSLTPAHPVDKQLSVSWTDLVSGYST